MKPGKKPPCFGCAAGWKPRWVARWTSWRNPSRSRPTRRRRRLRREPWHHIVLVGMDGRGGGPFATRTTCYKRLFFLQKNISRYRNRYHYIIIVTVTATCCRVVANRSYTFTYTYTFTCTLTFTIIYIHNINIYIYLFIYIYICTNYVCLYT